MNIIQRFISVPTRGRETDRQRKLLSIILVGFMTLTVAQQIILPRLLGSDLLFFAAFFLTLLINQRWPTKKLSFVFLVFFTISLLFSDYAEQIVRGRSLIFFAIPILLSSVLLKSYYSFFFAGLSALLIAVLGYKSGLVVEFPTILAFISVAIISWLATRSLENSINETEREEANENALLQSVGEGVIAVDKTGMVIYVNKKAEEILGRPSKEMIAVKYDAILSLHNEKGELISDDPMYSAITGGKVAESPTNISLYYQRKNIELFPVAYVISPILLKGDITGAVVVFRDITKENAVEEAKNELIALASHHLRTPATVVKWYAEMLLDSHAEKLSEKQKDYLREIHDANKRMIVLINTFLDISRMEIGKFVISAVPVQIKDIIAEVLSDFAPIIKKKKLMFEQSYDTSIPIFQSDPALLRIIVQNLALNAIDYTPQGGKIAVSFKLEKDRSLLLTVSDTGIGIPSSAKPNIFKKLFRAENAVLMNATGTGLGLYIVKKIVEQMNGQIWFESEENKGTTFFVAFPLSP